MKSSSLTEQQIFDHALRLRGIGKFDHHEVGLRRYDMEAHLAERGREQAQPARVQFERAVEELLVGERRNSSGLR